MPDSPQSSVCMGGSPRWLEGLKHDEKGGSGSENGTHEAIDKRSVMVYIVL